MALQWHWLRKQFGTADGGAYARLLDAQSPVHDLVAREVTQNSWDAARRWRAELPRDEQSRFQLVYEFRELLGTERKTLLSALHASELRQVLEEQGHTRLRFEQGKTVLDKLGSSSALKVLYIHDYGATGLRGDPVGDGLSDSDFFRAFGQIGGNDRDSGGGSFGFGKSAFIKASRIRCVIAYSSFRPTAQDPVTTRLWGFAYWPSFGSRSGVAQLGLYVNPDSGIESAPATDSLADELAQQFGFRVRNANSPADCGTSLLIVDHVLDPDKLKKALELHWWPAIEAHKSDFDVTIRTESEVLRLEPRSQDELKPFLRAYEIASDPNAQLKERECKPNWRAIRGEDGIGAGDLALLQVDADSPPVINDGNHAHVALIREPRMVVRYQPYPGSSPNSAIRGVFLASADSDPFLRKSEPASHTDWDEAIDESYGPDWERTRRVVSSVRQRIRREVLTFQKQLRNQSKRPKSSMKWANGLLAGLFAEPTKKGTGPSSTTRKQTKKRVAAWYESERVARARKSTAGGTVSVEETWSVTLLDQVKEPVRVVITFGAWLVPDGGDVTAADRIKSTALRVPAGFEAVGIDNAIGQLEPGKKLEFAFRTESYSRDWNIKTDLHAALDEGEQA